MLLLAAAVILQGWALARAFPTERLRADLRLGAYASANDRARTRPGRDRELARLAARAATLAQDHASVGDLEQRARAAMIAGEPEPALEWLDLGELRGSSELGEVASALRALAAKGKEDGELDPEIRRAWSAELEACRAALDRRGARGS